MKATLRTVFALCLLSLQPLGCAPHSQAQSPTQPPPPTAATTTPPSATSPEAQESSARAQAAHAPPHASPSTPAPAPATADSPPTQGQSTQGTPTSSTQPINPERSPDGESNAARTPGRSLPKLELKTVGLHVGGGPNDAATQKAFTSAIALQFATFRGCYRFVDNPKELAIFGVDLVVDPGEGKATVKKVRTTLKGAAFQTCMQKSFEAIRFRNPIKKPTSVSYSVRFSLAGFAQR